MGRDPFRTHGPRLVADEQRSELPVQVDVLIVGSGPVGATFARSLSELSPRAQVLMVEAGPLLGDPVGRHVRNIADLVERENMTRLSEGPGAPVASSRMARHFDSTTTDVVAAPGTFFVDPELAAVGRESTLSAAAMSTNVGGMGAHWAGATPDPRGRERIPFIEAGQWDDMLRVGRRLLATNPDPLAWSPEWGVFLERARAEFDPGLPLDGGLRDMPLAYQRSAEGQPYWTGVDVILGALAREPRDTFSLASRSLCSRLHVSGGKVTGAEISHLPSGQIRTVEARSIIVAADSLRTPQLLWASGIRPAALGRYLNDHVMVGGWFTPEYLDEPAEPDDLFPQTRTQNNLTETASTNVGWAPYSDEVHPLHGQFSLTTRPSDGGGTEGLAMVAYMLPKEPREEDRVWFSSDHSDPYGMPAVRFDYGSTDKDRALLLRAQAMIERAAGAQGARGISTVTQPNGMSLHYLGTTRMGEVDDGRSVCDSSSRVWGLENLYIGGNGVIPTALSSNPTLLSVSLASRAARAVARDLAAG
jgi:choline dehydrogenase-like flavoprotein